MAAMRRQKKHASSRALMWLFIWLGICLLDRPAWGLEKLVIGSKPFTENRLLAEIFAELIEAHSELEVERQFNLGATGICFEALRHGSIDLYPEYTGTALAAILQEPLNVSSDTAWKRVSSEFASRYDMIWLPPLGFNNTYAIVMRGQQTQALGIHSISDLARQQPPLKLGFSHEFMARSDGWPGLKAMYRLPQPNDRVRNFEHGLAYDALVSGQIDAMEAYSTDGKLKRYALELLRDDKGFFPPYQAAAIVKGTTLKRYPKLREILNRLSGKLDDRTMQNLNYLVEESGQSLERVAQDYLRRSGMIATGAPAGEAIDANSSFASFFWSQRQQLWQRAREHLLLSALAVLAACLIGIPLGLLIARFRPSARYVLAGAGLLQTLPSLALLAFLVPFIGTGFVPALLVLTLYALLPVLRNTYTGMLEVPAELKEVGRGIGLTPWQLLLRVELPLAGRVILAGIRTATVITIGTATLAAFIGAGGLGDPIVTGLTLKNVNWILLGVIPSAALALLADALLALLEKRLVNQPKTNP